MRSSPVLWITFFTRSPRTKCSSRSSVLSADQVVRTSAVPPVPVRRITSTLPASSRLHTTRSVTTPATVVVSEISPPAAS